MQSLPPALALHQCGQHRYELSGLRTASIRDQILRAHMLAHGLHMLEDTDFRRDLPVLVVGAGAAGVEVALTLQALGQSVVLVEANDKPFKHQRHVKTRVIDPCEYDFPHLTWRLGDMKAVPGPIPHLAFKAATPRSLAIDWDLALGMAKKGIAGVAATVQVQRNTTFDVSDLTQNPASNCEHWSGYAHPSKPRVRVGADFAAVVSTVGFSSEFTSLPSESQRDVVCRPFWANDDLLSADLGTHGRSGRGFPKRVAKVLVSGGGDGASQDIQRVLTGLCGKALFDRLNITLPQPELHNAMLAEHEAQRAHIWTWQVGTTAALRSPAWNWQASAKLQHQAWHDAYEDLATAIYKSWSGNLASRQSVLRDDVDLTWVISSSGLTYSYGLNRLLGLLVARLAAEATGRTLKVATGKQWQAMSAVGARPVMLYNSRVNAVAAASAHVHTGSCAHELHNVEVKFLIDGITTTVDAVDVLVARHGVKVERLFGGAAIPEQLVPIVLPR